MSLVVRPNSSAAGPVAGGSAKWLWAAIGALGVSVLALGATLVVQNRDRAPDVASAVQPAAALAPDAQSAAAANPSINPAAVQGVQGRPSAVAQAPAQQFAQRAPSPSYAPQPAYSGAPQGQQQVAMQRAAAPACMTCGRVESVQAFQQAAPATGIGAVAGGVIGGVLGNQVGKGSGRTAATVLGAVGGGYLGHTVEQRTRTTTAYQIRVRMDDGSVRTFTRSQPVAEGTAVRVEGRSFRVDNGQYGSGYGGGYSAQAPHSVRVADNGY
ncbi:glycine zipper 2TM domain-containing protein [Acidovorax sp. NCPPB 3859]|nr:MULTISPECIES: glycine zipper 2TM domain-containing protein [unclassified Acidovorax]MDA8449961.1 glycine zipper 2TM domain-containing protein [Acidovorax sp. GBBC 3297]MDA8459406.1 glycine zipper 2TM domain-containing protein [Acidovorax sp. GBBC 3333]MDA8464443.1 glycine zipper 2TM domain-containing protein [Acidovorax sp. GBBC 3332]MDA8469346.1 glycine zipper 2TM domain-containing protein [Acidovorax sp. GBBC 3299]WCM78982.1 glycine zipper 2TM domain-containing protein [Acidovorax sp. GBB